MLRCCLERLSQTRVSRTMTWLVIRGKIASVANWWCFVFRVFQSGLAFEQALVRPIPSSRVDMPSVKHLKHETRDQTSHTRCPRCALAWSLSIHPWIERKPSGVPSDVLRHFQPLLNVFPKFAAEWPPRRNRSLDGRGPERNGVSARRDLYRGHRS
jgi:hypothetical protein